MPDIDPYRVYTRQEAAEFLTVSEQWLSVLVERGELYAVRSGKRLLVPRRALEAYLRGERFNPHGLAADDSSTFPGTRSIFNEEA